MSSYQPPVLEMTGSVMSKSSTVNMELAKIRTYSSVESPESMALRQKEEEQQFQQVTWIASIAATVAMSTALLAMWLEATIVCYIAFVFPLVTSPLVVHQRRQIVKLPTFREEHNKLRRTVVRLSDENSRLEALHNTVASEAARLQESEQQLHRLAQAQGANVTTLQALVKENGAIVRQMRMAQESSVMMDVMKAIVKSDQSKDFVLDEKEMKVLMLRLQGIHGVSIDEETLRTAILNSKTNTLRDLAEITKGLLKKDKLQIERAAERSLAKTSWPYLV